MTDQPADQSPTTAPMPPAAAARREIGWRAAGIIALLATVGVGLYFRRYEGGGPNLFFVWSATLLIAATIVFDPPQALTGRCGDLRFPGPAGVAPACEIDAAVSRVRCK